MSTLSTEEEKQDVHATTTYFVGSVEVEGSTVEQRKHHTEEGVGPSIEEQKEVIADSTNCLKERLQAEELTLEQKKEIQIEMKKLRTEKKALELQTRKGKMAPDELLEWRKKKEKYASFQYAVQERTN